MFLASLLRKYLCIYICDFLLTIIFHVGIEVLVTVRCYLVTVLTLVWNVCPGLYSARLMLRAILRNVS